MLSWTKEHKQRAKANGLSLVKLQVQNKHCDEHRGNFEMAGAKPPGVAKAMYLTSLLQEGDPRIQKLLAVLEAP